MSMELRPCDRIIVSGKLIRRVAYRKNKPTSKHSSRWKVWERVAFVNTSGLNAIFLGYRTVSDGCSGFESECGYIYEPKSHKKVALVIRPDGRTNPFYAELRDIRGDND